MEINAEVEELSASHQQIGVRQFLNPSEVAKEISAFIADRDQMKILALRVRNYAQGVHYKSYNDILSDLINETVKRILEAQERDVGSRIGRRWPVGVPAMAMFFETIKSIIDELRNQSCALAENRRTSVPAALADEGKDAAWLEHKMNVDVVADTAALNNVNETLEEIFEIFHDDKIALECLKAKHLFGFSPIEIQELYELTPVQYETINRRILRKKAAMQLHTKEVL